MKPIREIPQLVEAVKLLYAESPFLAYANRVNNVVGKTFTVAVKLVRKPGQAILKPVRVKSRSVLTTWIFKWKSASISSSLKSVTGRQ